MTEYAPEELSWRRVSGSSTATLPLRRRSAGRRPRHRGPRSPMYWRLLRLRRLRPNAWQRALLAEGVATVSAVLVLADVASAWTLLILPLAVAAVVKGHDLLAAATNEPGTPPTAPVGFDRLAQVATASRGRHRRSREQRRRHRSRHRQPVGRQA